MAKTKLIIGIGNPDEEYQNTRHNIGFTFLDYLAKKTEGDDFEFEKKLESKVAKTKMKRFAAILAKPQTYVNKSGLAAAKLKNFAKVKPEDIVVVQDDLDIPFGNTKISFDKNSGGHRGIESIIKALKTKKFYRLRIGLASPSLKKGRAQSDAKRDEFVRKFVLSKFTPSENEKLKSIFKEALAKIEAL